MASCTMNRRVIQLFSFVAVVCLCKLALENDVASLLGGDTRTTTASMTIKPHAINENTNDESAIVEKENNLLYEEEFGIDKESLAQIEKDNYFFRALQGHFSIKARQLDPISVMELYIQQHSHQQLTKEWNQCQESINNETTTTCDALDARKFVVAYYSCPMEVGNRMHRFMNAMFVAISSNRTLLWDYFTTANCLRDDESVGYHAPEICHSLDNITDCDSILHRHAWLPSHSEWKHRLRLNSQGDLMEDDKIGFNGPYDVNETKLFRIGKRINAQFILNAQSTPFIHQRLQNESNRIRAKQLLSLGLFFLYGMLFETVFTFRDYLLPSQSSIQNLPPITVYIHSRHPSQNINASDIQAESKCLEEFFPSSSQSFNNTIPRCAIIVMSDRETTLELLIQKTIDLNCIPLVANHSKFDGDFVEHGDFRGIGYFQDWALARNARSAGVAYHRLKRRVLRTSSNMIQSSIDFRRILEFYNTTTTNNNNANETTRPNNFPICFRYGQTMPSLWTS